jgi:hypothetical protein
MPTIGPDLRPMYYAHEAYNLLGKCIFRDRWEPQYETMHEGEMARFYCEETGKFRYRDDVRSWPNRRQIRIAHELTSTLANVFFATGRVVVWIWEDGEWLVASRSEFAEEKFLYQRFRREILTVIRGGVVEFPEVHVDKARMDHLIGEIEVGRIRVTAGGIRSWDKDLSAKYGELDEGEEVPEEIRILNNRPKKGAGGNPESHSMEEVAKAIIERYFSDPPPKSQTEAAKDIVEVLRKQGVLAPPGTQYIRGLIGAMAKLKYLG